MEKNISKLLLIIFSIFSIIQAVENDWWEGTPEMNDGATRDFYNRGSFLPWDNYMGDWIDKDNNPQGDIHYDAINLVDDDTPKWVFWEISNLIQEWVNLVYQNKGIFIRSIDSGGIHKFYSKDYSDNTYHPRLIINNSDTIYPTDDTYMESSTYTSMGLSEELRISGSNKALFRFNLNQYDSGTVITSAHLRMYDFAQYGIANNVGVFRCNQDHSLPNKPPILGIAQHYNSDTGIGNDPDVIFACDFESPAWADEWSSVGHPENGLQLDSDPENLFVPFIGKAVRSRVPSGSLGGMSLSYYFQIETGSEPEEIYWRYYHRFADSWNPKVQGGKMPGVAGTYGIAGWGGKKSDGTNGWSARGSFNIQSESGNPIGEKDNLLGWYCYHADMPGTYGDVWNWIDGYRGFLENNKWYCIDQYCKMNTISADTGNFDGILRAWIDGRLAFEKTDIRMRHVPKLKIEQIWMNIYHGGTIPTPEDIDIYFDNVVIATKYIGPANLGISVKEIPVNSSLRPINISNYPNPFTNQTSISYFLPIKGQINVSILDMEGRLIKTLVNKNQDAGFYKIYWDGYTERGKKLSTGIYIYRLSTGQTTMQKKLMLIR